MVLPTKSDPMPAAAKQRPLRVRLGNYREDWWDRNWILTALLIVGAVSFMAAFGHYFR